VVVVVDTSTGLSVRVSSGFQEHRDFKTMLCSKCNTEVPDIKLHDKKTCLAVVRRNYETQSVERDKARIEVHRIRAEIRKSAEHSKAIWMRGIEDELEQHRQAAQTMAERINRLEDGQEEIISAVDKRISELATKQSSEPQPDPVTPTLWYRIMQYIWRQWAKLWRPSTN
jgi:hypothetical protein